MLSTSVVEEDFSSKWIPFNGFVQVVDTQKWHTYLVRDEQGKTRRLSSIQ